MLVFGSAPVQLITQTPLGDRLDVYLKPGLSTAEWQVSPGDEVRALVEGSGTSLG